MAVVTRRSAASAQVTPPSSQQDERKPAETTSASSTRRTSITSSSKITAPSKQETSSSPLPNPRLLAQAEALARMTLELNVRAVTAQADRLEESIKQLTIKTACDEEFRKQHEVRLQSLWQELVATREQVKNLEGHRTGIDSEVEKYRQEANCGIKVFRDEIEEMRGLVESVSSHLDQLPTAAEARAVLDAVHMRSELCEVGIREPMLHTECSRQPVQYRIQETIKSTRRWHHDHKTTELPDAKFTANYLRKQSKRDPPMAVYLQRAIHRRIKRRRRGASSSSTSHRLQTLDDFCKDVTWQDVTQTVEDVLVKRADVAVRSLSQVSNV